MQSLYGCGMDEGLARTDAQMDAPAEAWFAHSPFADSPPLLLLEPTERRWGFPRGRRSTDAPGPARTGPADAVDCAGCDLQPPLFVEDRCPLCGGTCA